MAYMHNGLLGGFSGKIGYVVGYLTRQVGMSQLCKRREKELDESHLRDHVLA